VISDAVLTLLRLPKLDLSLEFLIPTLSMLCEIVGAASSFVKFAPLHTGRQSRDQCSKGSDHLTLQLIAKEGLNTR
jgi:hypothetical protein